MLRVSLVIFFLLGFGLAGLGVVYLTRGEFMPYHAGAVQTDWSALDANFRGLLLGLLKGLGAGALTAGGAIVLMTIAAWRASSQPYLILLPFVAIGYTSLLLYATWYVRTHTPGEPPFTLTLITLGHAALASALLIVDSRRS